MGRELQKHYGQTPQIVLTMPLLEGLDGVNKMSKSLDNYIGITEAPDDMFGKIMSISDELMWRYFELLSFRTNQALAQFKDDVEQGKNPRDIKFLLATEIITRFHSAKAASKAHDSFIARFQKGAMPDEMPEIKLDAPEGQLGIANVLKMAGLVSSTSDGMRMIRQGAVRIDGERIEDTRLKMNAQSEHVYQVGKRRFAKIKIS